MLTKIKRRIMRYSRHLDGPLKQRSNSWQSTKLCKIFAHRKPNQTVPQKITRLYSIQILCICYRSYRMSQSLFFVNRFFSRIHSCYLKIFLKIYHYRLYQTSKFTSFICLNRPYRNQHSSCFNMQTCPCYIEKLGLTGVIISLFSYFCSKT